MWFRQDLRLEDNPALFNASKSGEVIPVYIHDTREEAEWSPGEASKWWLYKSLKALIGSGVPLIVRQGDPLQILQQLITETGASSLHWNRLYEPYTIQRDELIKRSVNISAFSYNASLLFEPWTIQNKQGAFFKVFTPFWKKCLSSALPREIYPAPKVDYAQSALRTLELKQLNLLPVTNTWTDKLAAYWDPGEKGATQNLSIFLSEALEKYKHGRDFPSQPVTSKLSPHLHYGEISPHQILHEVKTTLDWTEENALNFISELGWREFSYYLLYHFPNLPHAPFQERFKELPWKSDKELLDQWQKGQTGYPIVDAGMRELWSTGYMHNRVRMIVASFLTKHCLVPWQDGAAWFWNTLVDADLASNSASWQWVAGCGVDASPYFRIFNPVTQSLKFDAKAEYVTKWVPELSGLPIKYIHEPWKTPIQIQREAKIIIGENYPHPIVNLSFGRARALEAYQSLKK